MCEVEDFSRNQEVFLVLDLGAIGENERVWGRKREMVRDERMRKR